MKLQKPFNLLGGSIVAALYATQALADDPCLEGTWIPDYFVMGEQMLAQTGGTGVDISGDVYMILFDGSGRYDVRALQTRVMTEGMPPTTVVITGQGQFTFTSDDGVFLAEMGDFAYNAQATIETGGTPMVMDIPLTDEMAPFGNMIGGFTCTDTDLYIQQLEGGVVTSRMVNHWTRVPDGS